ncbi:MAG: nucleoside recognition domain-containing protein [Armatimonadota bacterium]
MLNAPVLDVASEAVVGSLRLLLTIVLIVTPIMVVLEALRRADAFAKMERVLRPALSRARLSAEGSFALIVGFIFGLLYGAGPLMQVGEEGRVSRSEITRVGVFLGVCHAIVEDTALFVSAGASWLWLVPGRMLFAGLVTLLIGDRLADASRRRQRA